MEKGNILEGVRGLIGNIPNSFSVLEEEIDIDLQFEYFKQAKQQRTERKKDIKEGQTDLTEKDIIIDIDSLEADLYNNELDITTRKQKIVELASSSKVKAYRTLEAYRNDVTEELRDWVTLALQESKMHLESSLLDENQVFISTGMGGKGDKLRYSAALRNASGEVLTQVQQQVILNEVDFTLQAEESELEHIRFEEEFAIVKVLIPMDKDINAIFKQAIADCNHLGKFLQDQCIVTNVKEFTVDKLRKLFEKKVGEKKQISPDDLPFEVSGNLKDVIDEIKKMISKKIEPTNPEGNSSDSDDENKDKDESDD